MTRERRSSGVLLPVYALPGNEGGGTFGPEAYAFIDFLVASGQDVWQILPLGPSGKEYSPYKSLSAFAGNPAFISLELLVKEGMLHNVEMPAGQADHDRFDFQSVLDMKLPFLKQAFQRALNERDRLFLSQFDRFCRINDYWLDDFAMYMVLTEKTGTSYWPDWDEKLKNREEAAWEKLLRKHEQELRFQKFIQFIFVRQWLALKHYAQRNQVRIFGDLPIFVSYESADVWANPDQFVLDDQKKPGLVAGVPPDYFSDTGQLWGNPQYNWKNMKHTGYRWWLQRFSWNLQLYDLLRIDHFRGFEASWSIPAGSADATIGEWVKAPGRALLRLVQSRYGMAALVAEDLGYITPEVEYLRDAFQLPGMRVLQFAFDGKENNPHLPHQYTRNTIAYTGTHDNDTLKGWYGGLDRKQKALVKKYIHSDGKHIVWDLIRAVWSSSSYLAITTMQDLLALDSEARTNSPGQPGDNWTWRLPSGEYPSAVIEQLYEVTRLYGRASTGEII